MSVIPERDSPADFTTVHEFAQQYRVDASVVRSWIKNGHIQYVLVGPRHMRRIRKSDILKPMNEGEINGQSGTTTAVGTGTDAGGEQAPGASGGAGATGRPAPVEENKGRHRGAASGTR